MSLLSDRAWKAKYDSGRHDLVRDFYEPVLAAATRYDRSTGFFSARVLTLSAIGIEGLVRNQGHWRLVVGSQLEHSDLEAVERGMDPAQAIGLRIQSMPLAPEGRDEAEALELLSWLIARGTLEIRFAIPCDLQRRPIAGGGMFHEKAGIIEDKTGDRLAFNGSNNETPSGWGRNWESFHAFTSWTGQDGQARVAAEELSFRQLWDDEAPHCLVVDLPAAVRDDLLRFLPADDQLPVRLQGNGVVSPAIESPANESHQPTQEDLRPLAWGLIAHGATLGSGAERVGEATSTVSPWPHQVRAFERMYRQWPPRLLIADEVGLGKTIEAGLVLRQAWMAGRVKRVLILAPKAVVRQWQAELREKFNLDWPIYDGSALQWAAHRGRTVVSRPVGERDWHREPFVIVSSHLMRRAARSRELVEGAERWDLVILDEAHHARRKGGGVTKDRKPNRLLDLMLQLKDRADGLLLLTATPMQVHPKEVWDLLSLLRMPEAWTEDAFVRFFETAALPNPSQEQFEELARLFREAETTYGPMPDEMAVRLVPNNSRLTAKKVLAALRDQAVTERRRMETDRRRAAIRIMQAGTPVARVISRHTRELLRRYFREGRISTPVPERKVEDVFITLSIDERALYDLVENYISTAYNAAAPDQKNAVGFVMTIYRRRLSSSARALAETLDGRLRNLKRPAPPPVDDEDLFGEEDQSDEPEDEEAAEALMQQAGEVEERGTLSSLLELARRLRRDTKADHLLAHLGRLRGEGRSQVMVFTQYTDTLDFVREVLVEAGYRVLCYSGRGGERQAPRRRWTTVSREETKRLFSRGDADVLLCTDAAAEGLNFQFCGALINYDMPWNPMRVEQRIGRIDRLGQRFPDIRIINLHYEGTVETDIYRALRARINLFGQFVGRLQPILSALPKTITAAALTGQNKDEATSAVLRSVDSAEQAAFDLDDITADVIEERARPTATYDLSFLDRVVRNPALLPPGVTARPLGNGEYEYSHPGMTESLRITTRAEYYSEHPDSVALWSPGSALFPKADSVADRGTVAARTEELAKLL
ncbi:MAG: hypothetical protein AMXMBFR57_07210 [Acidimicrobiia bacterium]